MTHKPLLCLLFVILGKVLEKDNFSENGMIHEVDNVFTAQPCLDQYLRTKPEYSEFRKLYEILENYVSLDVLPPRIIADLLNAHMWSIC